MFHLISLISKIIKPIYRFVFHSNPHFLGRSKTICQYKKYIISFSLKLVNVAKLNGLKF